MGTQSQPHPPHDFFDLRNQSIPHINANTHHIHHSVFSPEYKAVLRRLLFNLKHGPQGGTNSSLRAQVLSGCVFDWWGFGDVCKKRYTYVI